MNQDNNRDEGSGSDPPPPAGERERGVRAGQRRIVRWLSVGLRVVSMLLWVLDQADILPVSSTVTVYLTVGRYTATNLLSWLENTLDRYTS